jgi:hypothetical protein
MAGSTRAVTLGHWWYTLDWLTQDDYEKRTLSTGSARATRRHQLP